MLTSDMGIGNLVLVLHKFKIFKNETDFSEILIGLLIKPIFYKYL